MTAEIGERAERRPLEGVAPVAAVVLWLLAAGLLTRQAVAVLRLPPERRLTDLVAWLGERGALSGDGLLYSDGRFTGTPLAGLVLRPLAGAGDDPGLGVVWTGLGLLLVAGLGMLVVLALPGPRSRRWALLPLPAVVTLLMVSLPVRDAFAAGGTGLVPVLLALAGFLAAGRYGRFAGVLLGLAAALEPPLLLFAAVLWWASVRGAGPGRRTAALWAGATFAAGTVLAWAALPSDSWTYWVHHLAGAGLGAAPGDAANQSLHGLLLRLGFTGPLEPALWAVLAGVAAALGLRRAGHYARDGQWLLAAAVTGCTAVAVSPVAWPHLHLWVLLAAVGRVGRRKGDRYVWPVFVVLVLTMDGAALVPHIAWLAPFGENVTLLAALLAACGLPFVSRRSAVWARPEPSGVFSRPNLMLELLLIRVGYFVYSYVRSLAAGGREAAEAHGAQILALERPLGLDVEHGLNQLVAASDGLTKTMNFYYGAFHFLVPIALLGVLYLRRPATYRWARTALSFATLLGLLGFWLYPLAPPRLMPGLGYVDTAHGPQDFDDPDFGVLTGISNQYAAMPSLHVGWSLWAAVVVVRVTPALWPRLLAVLYPVLTTVVVMGTANHYLLDAVGGAAVVAGGFGVAALWRHHTAGAAESGAPANAHGAGAVAAPPAARAPAGRAEPLTDPGAAVR
ncbi:MULTISPECIES: bifunctional glycosyltransferase 87/phosphatase PAP2 family protein [unclassified Streptomyces]|uniref:bifunctional glycosyltransferase 87/phosphatase PAP2 family protein n=1 Tax=unclassified Streptomyces TaxID=2593676 RepID=UPI002FC2F6FF